MPSHTETLLADAAGTNMTAAAGGTELPNKSSRRRMDFNEYSFCRLQWGCDTVGPGLTLRAEYSVDNGTTWALLTNPVEASNVVGDNSWGTWDPVPEELVTNPYNILCRAVVVGSGGGVRVRYAALTLR